MAARVQTFVKLSPEQRERLKEMAFEINDAGLDVLGPVLNRDGEPSMSDVIRTLLVLGAREAGLSFPED